MRGSLTPHLSDRRSPEFKESAVSGFGEVGRPAPSAPHDHESPSRLWRSSPRPVRRQQITEYHADSVAPSGRIAPANGLVEGRGRKNLSAAGLGLD